MAEALILFGHGARDPAWAAPLLRVRGAMLARQPSARIELAFLEFIAPNLADCVAGLAGEGIGRIVVLPMFIAQGGHLQRQVPEMLAALRIAHPGIEFELASPVGECDAVIQSMAAVGLELLKK